MKKLVVIFLVLFCTKAYAFTPTDKIMPLSQIKSGMTGYAKTVLQGTKISSFKVKILGVLPSKGIPHNLILIHIEDKAVQAAGGIAEGMSGSPVYINGRLIGAIGYGWSFSDNNLGLVTPIEEMIGAAERTDKVRDFSITKPAHESTSPDITSRDISGDISYDASVCTKMSPLLVDGISRRFAGQIGRRLNRSVMPLGGGVGIANHTIKNWKAEPGASIGVALAWGDVTVGGIGTLTAISKDGRFLAFAHPMDGRGDVSYALTNSSVLHIIPGMETSFKLGYLGDIVGTVTQDRPEAIAGNIGRLAPALSYTVNFINSDTGERERKRFQTVYDPYTSLLIAPPAILGLIDSMWAQQGAGTAVIKYSVSGGNMRTWERKNIFVSSKDIVKALKKEIESVIKVTALNPFREIWPYGATFDVTLSRERKVAYIQKLEIENERKIYHPGDKIKLAVTVRKWRERPVVKHFELAVPKEAMAFCKITVRGGGIDEPEEEALENGARAISTYDEYMAELSATETNNLLIAEIDGPKKSSSKKTRSDKKSKKDDDNSSKDELSPDDLIEKRLVSEIQSERIDAHELAIEDTDSYIEGKLNKFIRVKHPLQEAIESGKSMEEIFAMLSEEETAKREENQPEQSEAEETDEEQEASDEENDEAKTEDDSLSAIPRL